MTWEPSVRTRHLTVIIFLILVTASALLCFNLARLLNAHAASKHEKFDLLKAPIYNAAQQAIFNRPLESPQMAIGIDSNVRSLIKVGANDPNGFSYVALIALDGAVIAYSDPHNLLKSAGQPDSKISAMAQFESSRWYRQLWDLWRHDHVYEMQNRFDFRNEPFARLVVGVSASNFREDLAPTIKLSGIFASVTDGSWLLTAVVTSNLVRWSLTEVMDSIDELDGESSRISVQRPVNVEMQSIEQRLRELGRRFAGNRTEIEEIRDQLQQVVGSVSDRVL